MYDERFIVVLDMTERCDSKQSSQVEIKKLIVPHRTLDIETGRMENDGCPNPGLTTSVSVVNRVLPETNPAATAEAQTQEV